ncbi:MAG: type II secretion system inner membrane protein GspF [Candidatus Hydrogenedens sp.]|jgi:general secretion pathway protein F|nr:type II secretion system inner membrane protein GspF [Candidatus Hydrogenedens sp.]
MALYQYKAIIKSTGKTTRGVIDADGIVQARRKLREQDLYPTDISEDTSGGKTGGMSGRFTNRGRVSTRDIALMTRQLAVLLRAGMSLLEALNALIDQTSRMRLRAAIYEIRDKVNSGQRLGDSLADHPRIFSDLYVNMVRAGEISGTLEQVLLRLADILERQHKLRSQIISTLAYPGFMGFFSVGIVVFLVMVIVPRITRMFERQEAELPALTEGLIAFSGFASNYWWLILLVLGLFFVLFRLWVARPEGRRKWDRLKLKFPLYGPLHLKLVCARFTRTMGTMLQSGLMMLPALEVVNAILGNAYIQECMDDVKVGVRRGRDLAAPLKETALFPPMMIHMIELGQRSGEIEDMLVQVADTFDEDVRLTIDALVALIEPIIIIIMGLVVAVLVLAILLPIFQMSTTIGSG